MYEERQKAPFYMHISRVRAKVCSLLVSKTIASKFRIAREPSTARKMMALTRSINETLTEALGAPDTGVGQRVTCYTCHRGSTQPLTRAPGGSVDTTLIKPND